MKSKDWKPSLYSVGANVNGAFGYIAFTEQQVVLKLEEGSSHLKFAHSICGVTQSLYTQINLEEVQNSKNFQGKSYSERLKYLAFCICFEYNNYFKKNNYQIVSITDVVIQGFDRYKEISLEEMERLMDGNNKDD